MDCRRDCGACCIAISISSPLPGLPQGKPAGVRCPHLNESNLCSLFASPERPAICSSFKPNLDTCGGSRSEAMCLIVDMERVTAPQR